MTKGDAKDQDFAVGWARDNGINFFDTAPSYGNGASETALGRALGGNTTGITVSTKVGLPQAELANASDYIERSLHESLVRLGLDYVDLFQLHNTIGEPDLHGTISAEQVLNEVLPVFNKLRDAGKTRYLGFTAKGDTGQLLQLVRSNQFDSAQIFYNLLVPTAGEAVAEDYPAQDYKELLKISASHGVGAIGVRVLAGGALSGSIDRHPLGMPEVAPIGSDTDYATDVERGMLFMPLVKDGVAGSLPELAAMVQSGWLEAFAGGTLADWPLLMPANQR